MKVLVPAKINTLLHLLHKREDGYHEICSHLVPVSLYDLLEVESINCGGIGLEVSGADFNEKPKKNLVFQAAELFQKQIGIPLNLKIRLEKKIPVAAGLGGGSADAAAMLHVLNHLHKEPFSRDELKQIGLSLGADVPFFIDPRPSEVRGIGEIIRPLKDHPSMPIVILKPSFSISTAEAFRDCIPQQMEPPPTITNPHKLTKNLENRFEFTLFRKFPELHQLKTLCLKHGALGASVSGSGSALFALFGTESEQMNVAKKLKRTSNAEIYPCKMLKTHTYDPL